MLRFGTPHPYTTAELRCTKRTTRDDPAYASSRSASSTGWLSAARWPPGISSTSRPRRSRATRLWNSSGKRRSSRPTTTRVGTSGQRSSGQGCEKGVMDCDGSPRRMASAVTSAGTSWKKSTRTSIPSLTTRSWAAANSAYAFDWPVFSHHAPPVSPGIGIIALRSTRSRVGELDARPRPRSPRGARPTTCRGSAASPASGAAARPARAGGRGAVRARRSRRAGRRAAASSPVAIGNHGMNAMPLALAVAPARPRDCGRPGCSGSAPTTIVGDRPGAPRSASTVDLGERRCAGSCPPPAARASSPSWSSSGTFGSIRCSW